MYVYQWLHISSQLIALQTAMPAEDIAITPYRTFVDLTSFGALYAI
jgi:hypothetical protein